MNALIFGKRRQGKSTLALRLALIHHHTVVIFDPNNQYELGAGVPMYSSIPQFEAWLQDEEIDHGLIVYRPDVRSIETEFEDVVDLLWEKGHYALVVDESTYVQGFNRIHPSLERLVRQAPRDGARNAEGAVIDVSVIQTLHRPADAHSLCRALASDMFYFQVSLPRDLQAVEDQWGEEVAEELTDLPRWVTLHAWQSLDGKECYSIWTDPSVWKLDINAGRGASTS